MNKVSVENESILCGSDCFAVVGLSFTLAEAISGDFDIGRLDLIPARWFGVLSNDSLLVVPFFVFIGAVLEKSGIGEGLLDPSANFLAALVAVAAAVGTLLAATGVVAATLIVMGLLSLTTMLPIGYDHKLATSIIISSGTLAHLVLILLSSQINMFKLFVTHLSQVFYCLGYISHTFCL